MAEDGAHQRDLADRSEALARILELARGRYPDDTVSAAAAASAKVADRLRHGTAHTVVALAGPTGSGKSSLFNALVGEEVSPASVRRPTTGTTHAATFAADPSPSTAGADAAGDAGGLLDWLGVQRRHLVATNADADFTGLVLLDLPDHDSTAVEHQLEVDRLVGLVDVLVWVTEPQKYADHVMHERYVRPLAGHGDVMVFVVSKADLLSETDREALLLDYSQRLTEDGIVAPRVLSVSTASPEPGIASLAELLVDAVDAKAAAVARLEADLAQAAGWFVSVGVDRATVAEDVQRNTEVALAAAAGSDQAADAVARQHERNGALATGWPATRWVRKLRRQPFGDVPVAAGNPAAEAKVDVALRNAGEAVGEDLGAPWPAALRQAVSGERDQVIASLGRVATSEARDTLARPRWWKFAAWWQRMGVLLALVGGGWLLAMAVLGGFLKLDTDPLTLYVPGADWLPVPTALLLGGIAWGVLGAFIARIANRIGARRRSARVRSSIEQAVADVAQRHVVDPMNRVLAERDEVANLVAEIAG